MNTRTAVQSAFAVSMMMGTIASATEFISYDEPLILSPCDDATVTVEWVEDNAGWPGTLSWIDPGVENGLTNMFYSESVTMGDEYVLGRTYALGERVDFMYTAGWNAQHSYRTNVENDWGQFRISEISPTELLVYIEDIPLPGGDHDYNDAVFRVSFSHVPAPGSTAFIGLGLAAISTRRRR